MSLRYQLAGVQRWLLALIAAAILAVTAGGVLTLSTLASEVATASPIACNGPCTDPGGGGG